MIQFFGLYSHSLSTFSVPIIDHMVPSNFKDSDSRWNSYSDIELFICWKCVRHGDSESEKVSAPLYSTLGIAIMSSSRLDNKAELGTVLNLSEKDPDTDFIAAAYQRWGKKCVNYLSGDWIFALHDKKKHELFLAKDHFGNTGLFYYQTDRFFAFSSDIRQLLLLEKIPKRINELFVAKTLVAWPKEGGETAYEGILRLPPAHHLEVKDQKVKLTRYYFLEETCPLHFKHESDYFEQFLDLYTKSVRFCLQGEGPFASTLSGGLDSGSVSALAARELLKKGLTLHSYTSVPLYAAEDSFRKNRFGDERFYAQQTAYYSGNIKLNFIDANACSLVNGIRNHLFSHAEPGHAVGNYYWIQAIFRQAQKDGIGVLLTGQAGNSTVSWPGLTDSRRLTSFFKNPSFSVFRELALRIAPYPVINYYRHLGLEKEPWLNYSPISRSACNRLTIADAMKRDGHDPHFLIHEAPLKKRFRILQPAKSHSGSKWQANSLRYGIEVRDPTMNKELVEFCIGVPDRIYRSNGQDRYLMRKAMEGILPDQVRLNNKRGLQGADNIHRARAEAAEISGVLEGLKKSELANQFLDLPKMETVFKRVLSEISADVTEKVGTVLLRGIDTGLFLKAFEEKYM